MEIKLRGASELFYHVAISICGLMARGALIIKIGTLNYEVSCGLFYEQFCKTKPHLNVGTLPT